MFVVYYAVSLTYTKVQRLKDICKYIMLNNQKYEYIIGLDFAICNIFLIFAKDLLVCF